MKSEFDRYWAIASAKINLPDTNENAATWKLLYSAARNAYLCARRKHGGKKYDAIW